MLKKLKYIMFLILFTTTGAFAQHVVVSGDIEGLKDEQVIFVYYDGKEDVADTVNVQNGKFIWRKNMPEVQKIGIVFADAFVHFFVQHGNIEISGKADNLNQLSVRGSFIQDEQLAYQNSFKDIEDQLKNVMKGFSSLNKQEQAVVQQKRVLLWREQSKREKDYVDNHKNSPISISIIREWAIRGDYEEAKLMYDHLDNTMRESSQGQRIAKRLEELSRGFIGAKMMAFIQDNEKQVPISFADYKGKYVLVDFWASWCGPCRAENPNLLKSYDRFKSKNFTVIGVSLDTVKDSWIKAIHQDKMPWVQVSDLKGFKNEIASYYGILSIPSNFLIDPDGKIIAKNLRGDDLNRKLAELLK